VLVWAAVAVALLLTRTIRREAAARERAAARAELERTLAREASHRVKNDLQTAADLLLLTRPEGSAGAAFDETAARIRSIAAVHNLLTETEDGIDGGSLLQDIAAGSPVPVGVEAEPVTLDAATARKLGIVANELLTNAYRHGAAPIHVQLTPGLLRIEDGGAGVAGAPGFGLSIVRRMVEQGLDGRFELRAIPGGGTRAEVVFRSVR
jgi:two-component sensor histidine kinase